MWMFRGLHAGEGGGCYADRTATGVVARPAVIIFSLLAASMLALPGCSDPAATAKSARKGAEWRRPSPSTCSRDGCATFALPAQRKSSFHWPSIKRARIG